MKTYFSFLFLSLFFISQITAQNSTSENEAIVRRMVNRLKGKKQKTKHIEALEKAFAEANENDFSAYRKWQAEKGLDALERTYKFAVSIANRQARVATVLPLVSTDGYRPVIKLLPAEKMLEESRKNLVTFYLEDINADLSAAKNGEKLRARKAYSTIKKMKREYDWETARTEILQDSAYFLGRYYILLKMKNDSWMDGNEVIRELAWDGISSSGRWQVIHTRKKAGVAYDFFANFNITDVDVSRDEKDENERELSVEIEVKKATDEEEAKYETVTAEVTDVSMHKIAEVEATLTIKNANGKIVLNEKFEVNSVFKKEYCTYDGDERALGDLECDTFTIGNKFPSDDDLLEDCAEQLKTKVECELRRVDVRK